jgi:hypothetical protein
VPVSITGFDRDQRREYSKSRGESSGVFHDATDRQVGVVSA